MNSSLLSHQNHYSLPPYTRLFQTRSVVLLLHHWLLPNLSGPDYVQPLFFRKPGLNCHLLQISSAALDALHLPDTRSSLLIFLVYTLIVPCQLRHHLLARTVHIRQHHVLGCCFAIIAERNLILLLGDKSSHGLDAKEKRRGASRIAWISGSSEGS